MSAFVLDGSVAASWVLTDEASEASAYWLERATLFGAVVPAHWVAEVTNVALQGLKRGRLDDSGLVRGLEILAALAVEVEAADLTNAWSAGLDLARLHKLTLYDALYLELALRRDLPLATFDGDLRRAAEAEGVTVT